MRDPRVACFAVQRANLADAGDESTAGRAGVSFEIDQAARDALREGGAGLCCEGGHGHVIWTRCACSCLLKKRSGSSRMQKGAAEGNCSSKQQHQKQVAQQT